MSGPDPADVWDEVVGWLRVAEADRRAATVCMDSGPPLLEVAAFHCQQAVEKLLKGFLVHASVDFTKTHDLERLGAVVVVHFPLGCPLPAGRAARRCDGRLDRLEYRLPLPRHRAAATRTVH